MYSTSTKCPRCGYFMQTVATTQQLNIKGTLTEVPNMLHLQCPSCGSQVETPELMDSNGALVLDRFRTLLTEEKSENS